MSGPLEASPREVLSDDPISDPAARRYAAEGAALAAAGTPRRPYARRTP